MDFSLEDIKKYLNRDIDIKLFDELESTNNTLKTLAVEGADDYTTVIAKKQTGGKGRLGRSFFSPEGGLYLSLLLKPDNTPEAALQITVCAASAVAVAIEKTTGIYCGIKWVNDIYLKDKKVCGILTEGAINPTNRQLDYAVLGIGLNICTPKTGFPNELSSIAGALYEKDVPENIPTRITAEIINTFLEYYENLSNKSYLNEYRRRSILINKEITYLSEGAVHNGKVLEIDSNAALIVEENKKKIKLSAGEVSVKLN